MSNYFKDGFEDDPIGRAFNRYAGLSIEEECKENAKNEKISRDGNDTSRDRLRVIIAERIIDEYSPIFDGNDIWFYMAENGCFCRTSEARIGNIIENLIDKAEENSTQLTSAVIAQIKRTTLNEKFVFNAVDDFLLNFKNCTYNLRSGDILSHSEEYVFNYVIDANFKKYAKSDIQDTHFMNFVCTLCEGDKQKVHRLQEMCGVLLTQLPLKGAVFWIGIHDSGKSTLAKFLSSLLPAHAVSSVPLELFDDKFRLSSLKSSRLNVGGEISKKTNALQWKRFKEITGGDIVSVEAKYQNAENVVLKTKFLFIGNYMPNMPKDDALNDRIQKLEFMHSVPREERDPELFKKLSAEKDIFAYWCIKGAMRYIKKGFMFTEYHGVSDVLLSPVERFLKTSIVFDTDSNIICKELYAKFIEFFLTNYPNEKIISDKSFYAQVQEMIPTAEKTRRKVNGKNAHVFTGLKLKEEVL